MEETNDPQVEVTADDGVSVSVVSTPEDPAEVLRQAVAYYEKAVQLYGTPEDPMSPVWRLRDRKRALAYARQDLEDFLENGTLDEEDEDMPEMTPEPPRVED